MANILLVDDDRSILRALKIGLTAKGHLVTAVKDGTECLTQIISGNFDIIILDLGLPDYDGVDIVKHIRGFSDIPILVLSATHLESTKVSALDNGADDYVTKPFGMAELEARIRSLTKKYARSIKNITDNVHTDSLGPTLIKVGKLTIDFIHYGVDNNGVPVNLTAKEFEILAYLAKNIGKVCTHRMILKDVWGDQYLHETEYLRVYIYRLRKKLDDVEGKILQSNPGIGYSLNYN